MRDYAKVAPQFWTGDTGRFLRSCGPETQVIALYLMTCPSANMIGLYYLPLPVLVHETGIPFEGASKALRRASEGGFAHYDEATETVWVVEMARFQVGDKLEKKDNRVKAIAKELQSYRKSPFYLGFFGRYEKAFHLPEPSPLQAPCKPLASPFEAPSKPGAGAGAGAGAEAVKKLAAADAPPNPRHRSTVDLFASLFRELHGGEYRVNGAADGAAVKRLLAWPEATDAEIEARIRVAFADKFFREKKPTIAYFVGNWNSWQAAKQAPIDYATHKGPIKAESQDHSQDPVGVHANPF